MVATAQTNVINHDQGFTVMDAPTGTYFKDINDTFSPYLGTWKYQNGNEILIVKLEKVTKYYYSEYGNYVDFIKGNYSYTINDGATYITNTIVTNQSTNDPNINPIFSPGPNTHYNNLNSSFTDQLHQKSADAEFTFVTGSTTQLQMKLIGRSRGYIYPEVAPPAGFSIPNNVILIKQP